MTQKNDTAENLKLAKYEVGNVTWFKEQEAPMTQVWTSNQWWRADGDGVELFIEIEGKAAFELHCFSGIPSSSINVDTVDFGTLWHKAFKDTEAVGAIGNYTFIQQCIMLANWFCSLFCEWIDASDYEQH